MMYSPSYEATNSLAMEISLSLSRERAKYVQTLTYIYIGSSLI